MGLTPRSTSGRFHLELDGVPCGFLRAVEGGSISADVVTERPGAEHYLKKRLGAPRQEPIVLTFGFSLSPDVYDWINAAWNGTQTAREGAIFFSDASFQAKKVLTFQQALITEVAIPTLEGSSKDACFLAMTIQPEHTEMQKASGKVAAPAAKAKQWLAANFRLEIDGLDCKKVNKVHAFAVKLAATDQVHDRRERVIGSPIDFPGLRVRLPEAAAATWLAWHEDFVVLGNCDDSRERNGSLVALDSSLKGELLRIELGGVGIHRLAPEKAEASSETVSRLVADLYCERMTFVP